MNDFKYLFQDKYENKFCGVALSDFYSILKTIDENYYISPCKVIESASFSMAMIIRSHLGLTAEGGNIVVVVKDNLAGSLALATARRLYNAGTMSTIIIPKKELGDISNTFEREAEAVSALGLELIVADPKENEKESTDLFLNAHNVIMGTFDENDAQDETLDFIANILNDLSTPIHSIMCPHGICPNTGKKLSVPIYSSSTLSLGIPLSGLNVAHDYLGRHYICEISIPKELSYEKANLPNNIFSEQPVCQIFNAKIDAN